MRPQFQAKSCQLWEVSNSHYIASDQGEGLEAMSMLFGGEDHADDGPPQLRQDQALVGVATIEDEDEDEDEDEEDDK